MQEHQTKGFINYGALRANSQHNIPQSSILRSVVYVHFKLYLFCITLNVRLADCLSQKPHHTPYYHENQDHPLLGVCMNK